MWKICKVITDLACGRASASSIQCSPSGSFSPSTAVYGCWQQQVAENPIFHHPCNYIDGSSLGKVAAHVLSGTSLLKKSSRFSYRGGQRNRRRYNLKNWHPADNKGYGQEVKRNLYTIRMNITENVYGRFISTQSIFCIRGLFCSIHAIVWKKKRNYYRLDFLIRVHISSPSAI